MAQKRKPKTPRPDPIFAAIQAHRTAYRAFEKVIDADSAFEKKHGVGHGMDRAPTIITEKSQAIFESEAEIADRIGAKIAAFKSSVTVIGRACDPKIKRALAETERVIVKSLTASWNRARKAREREQRASGWTALRQRYNAACRLTQDTVYDLCTTKPTTMAGMVALTAYSSEIFDNEIDGESLGSRLMATLAVAMMEMAL